MDWLLPETLDFGWLALSGVIMFTFLVLLTRISGVRSFSKMSAFDFAITVAIGSVLASVILAKDPPVLFGLAALATLFAIQIGVAVLRVHVSKLREILDNAPRLIMVGDEMFEDQMRKAKITEDDLLGKLREANVLDFSQIEAVVAETTGDVSVLHCGSGDKRLDPSLLKGVIGAERFLDSA